MGVPTVQGKIASGLGVAIMLLCPSPVRSPGMDEMVQQQNIYAGLTPKWLEPYFVEMDEMVQQEDVNAGRTPLWLKPYLAGLQGLMQQQRADAGHTPEWLEECLEINVIVHVDEDERPRSIIIEGERTMTFTPDLKIVASCSNEKTVRVWDAVTGRLKATLRGHRSHILSVAFSPDGRSLASGSVRGLIKVWDPASGKVKATLGPVFGGAVDYVAFSPDGKTLATCGWNLCCDRVRLFDIASGKERIRLKGPCEYGSTCLAFSPDGKTLAVGHPIGLSLWDVAIGKQKSLNAMLPHVVQSVAFSPDGRILASVDRGDVIKLWDTVSGTLAATLVAERPVVPEYVIWQPVKPPELGYNVALRVILMSPGRRPVTPAELRIADNRPGGLIGALAFSPDGKVLASASGGDRSVTLWDMATHKKIATLPHTKWVNTLAFSRDGNTLAAGSGECIVKFWKKPWHSAAGGESRSSGPEIER